MLPSYYFGKAHKLGILKQAGGGVRIFRPGAYYVSYMFSSTYKYIYLWHSKLNCCQRKYCGGGALFQNVRGSLPFLFLNILYHEFSDFANFDPFGNSDRRCVDIKIPSPILGRANPINELWWNGLFSDLNRTGNTNNFNNKVLRLTKSGWSREV